MRATLAIVVASLALALGTRLELHCTSPFKLIIVFSLRTYSIYHSLEPRAHAGLPEGRLAGPALRHLQLSVRTEFHAQT